MGYSRVDSQLLSRALCTWTFTGFANAGSAVLALHALTALVHTPQGGTEVLARHLFTIIRLALQSWLKYSCWLFLYRLQRSSCS